LGHRARSAASIQEVVDQCDLIFITTPDSAIATTTEQARWRVGKSAVHCSGATEVAALAAAAREGASIGGFHPMQTFGDPEVAVASLPGCTVTIEAAEPLNGILVALAQHLECRVNRLPPGIDGRGRGLSAETTAADRESSPDRRTLPRYRVRTTANPA
jgi:predicted short-subunit dehydrogenase-like oxidoreductase (DUF2520 family)